MCTIVVLVVVIVIYHHVIVILPHVSWPQNARFSYTRRLQTGQSTAKNGDEKQWGRKRETSHTQVFTARSVFSIPFIVIKNRVPFCGGFLTGFDVLFIVARARYSDDGRTGLDVIIIFVVPIVGLETTFVRPVNAPCARACATIALYERAACSARAVFRPVRFSSRNGG